MLEEEKYKRIKKVERYPKQKKLAPTSGSIHPAPFLCFLNVRANTTCWRRGAVATRAATLIYKTSLRRCNIGRLPEFNLSIGSLFN